MSEPTIAIADFRAGLLTVLDETFDNGQGIFLDRGTSMFATLATISAEEASRPVGGGCATLAAQVNHTCFYLDVLNRLGRGEAVGRVDWAASWRVDAVGDGEWRDLIDGLRQSYTELREFATSFAAWDARMIGGAFGIVAHCAYHLGEIRQALCLIKGHRTNAA